MYIILCICTLCHYKYVYLLHTSHEHNTSTYYYNVCLRYVHCLYVKSYLMKPECCLPIKHN